ncbi:MAG TPA: hypothetical protein VKK31_12010 [Thermoanaerobaculia bacterium]|nr:hypothetical protein [Thermoanaerobaculia bacterium]
MKRTTLTILTLTAALLWVAPAGADEAENIVRSFRQQIPVGDADRIYLEFPVGEVTVEAWDNPQVNLDVKIACNKKKSNSRCAKAAEGLRLVYNTSGDRLHVEVKNWPKFSGTKGLHVIATVNVPRNLPLRTELGVGELSVQGTAGDLDVDLGVGEVNITLPKEAIRSVDLDTGVGEASLTAAGRHYESSGLMARELSWDKGTGRAGVKVECGVGEIDVILK